MQTVLHFCAQQYPPAYSCLRPLCTVPPALTTCTSTWHSASSHMHHEDLQTSYMYCS